MTNVTEYFRRSRWFLLVLVLLCCLGGASALFGQTPPWTAINSGLTNTNLQVRTLAIDPATPTTLYGGQLFGSLVGAFKTTNGGNSWTAINNGLTGVQGPLALAIDPITPTTVYAGLNGAVDKSIDGGGSWTPTNLGPNFVDALAIDPGTPTTLYAGTAVNGVFKSTDGGSSWTAINNGLPGIGPPIGNVVFVLAVDRATPTTLYIGTSLGAFKSTNGGGSWTAINNGLSSPSSTACGFGIPPGTPCVFALAIDPATPTTLYAGTNADGVLKSTNAGGSWTAIHNGLTITRVQALAIDPATPTTVYAGGGGGVFKSTDGGLSWTGINNGLTSTNVSSLAIDPLTPTTIYAGTLGGGVFVLRQAPSPALPRPIGLSAIVGNGTIYLRWAPYPAHVDSFLVDIEQLNGNSFSLLGTVTCTPRNAPNTGSTLAQDPSCLLTSLPGGNPIMNGVTYRFTLRATNAGLQSDPSITVRAVPGSLIGNQPPRPRDSGKAVLFLHGFLGSGSLDRSFKDTLHFMKSTLDWEFGGQLYHVAGEIDPTHVDQTGSCEFIASVVTGCLDYGNVRSTGDFFTVNFGSLTADYADGTGYAHQGLEVQSFLVKLRHDQMTRTLQVVAHSNGGLAARSFIERFPIDADANLSLLVTYGTPHLGADVFDFFGLALGAFLPFEGAREAAFGCTSPFPGSTIVLSDFLFSLDTRLLIQHNIDYVSIIGKIPLDRPFDDCHSKHWDGLVPITSANLNNVGTGSLSKPVATLTTNHVHIGEGNDFPAIFCGLDPNCAMFRVFSPVDIEVTTPSGRQIATAFTSIPGASYMNIPEDDSHEGATVLIPFTEGGQYTVRAIPKPDALATDIFTITLTQNGLTTMIADHLRIQDIPPDGFHPHVNSRPFANAGSDQTVECMGANGAPVTLNGSMSGDQDGDTLTYQWTDSVGNVVGNSAIVTALAQTGAQTYTLTVTDPSGLSATAQTHVSVRDTTAPILTLTKSTVTVLLPTATATGASANLSGIASATDICDPNPTITNDAPANSFFPIGTTTVSFTATDHSGNSSQKKLTVQVVYASSGYLVPVLNNGSAIFNSGRTIPVKFQLTASDGTFVTNAVANLQVFQVLNTPTGTVDMSVDTVASGSSNTGTLFRFDPTSNQYIYNLSAQSFSSGTYLLRTTLNDGTTHDVQISIR